MGAALLVSVIIIIASILKKNSESGSMRRENPWKENMTDDERKAWLIKGSDIVQREAKKKMGL